MMPKQASTENDLMTTLKMKAAIKSEPGISFQDTLGVKTIDELKRLAKAYFIKGYSKLDKHDLVEAVGNALFDAGRMEEVLYILETLEWQLFKSAAETECLKSDGYGFADGDFLQSLGYVQSYYYDNGFNYVMPREVREVYDDLKKGGIVARKERSDLLSNYAMAAVELYGVISQDDFVALFNSQNADPTDIDEVFRTLLRQIAVDKGDYCFWDEYIVSDEFEEDDFKGVNLLLRQIGDKPRYIPEKHELLKYADPDYYEPTEATRALLLYIRGSLSLDECLSQAIVDEIHDSCAVDNPLQECLSVFYSYAIPLEMEHLQKLAELISDVNNSTRLWSNNGHTPNEIFNQYEWSKLRPLPRNQAKAKKVGRNDPCPCGSGKKYKKCCGR